MVSTASQRYAFVVLEKPLGERRELALDRGRLLRLQLRRTELVVAGTWHAAQGGILARGVSGKNEANGGVVFAKGMPDLKLLAHNGAARRRESRKSQTSLASFAGSPHQQDTLTESAGDRLGCRRSDLRKSAGAVISPIRPPHRSASMPERAPAARKNSQTAWSTLWCMALGACGPDTAHGPPGEALL